MGGRGARTGIAKADSHASWYENLPYFTYGDGKSSLSENVSVAVTSKAMDYLRTTEILESKAEKGVLLKDEQDSIRSLLKEVNTEYGNVIRRFEKSKSYSQFKNTKSDWRKVLAVKKLEPRLEKLLKAKTKV